jgi:hypothetical protein
VHAEAVLLDVVRREREVRQVLEALVGGAVDVQFRILPVDDDESSAWPMISALLGRSLPHMKGGAMPTYSIHHFTIAAPKPEYRPRSARRIAMSARAASVARRKTLRRAA